MTIFYQRKTPRREKDNYPTPAPIARWVVQHCLELVALEAAPYLTFLEPGCGDEAPFAAAAEDLYDRWDDMHVMDIRQVMPNVGALNLAESDFLDPNSGTFMSGDHYEIITTNPPFNQALPFWQRSMELLSPTGILGFIVKQNFLGTKKRSEVWRERPPAEAHILYPRPSFTGDGSTDFAQEYCAVFWYGDLIDKFRAPGTQLSWLNVAELDGKNDA